jgi:amino acid adenylation domain-containing protein
VGQLLKQVFLSLQARAEYEISPLTEIMKQSELSGEGFFDSIVVVENYPLDREMTQGKGAIRFVSYETAEMTNYDLTLAITLGNGENLGESIRVHLDYNQELFEPAVIERMAGHFEKILVAITKNLSLPLEKLELVTEKEKHLILKEFNKPAIPYPENKTLHELFTEQAVKTPDLIAVFFQDQGITYRELDRQSSLLANSLRELGAAADEVVGLMTAPSLNMYIGIIAILKAGGAYLPIHLSNPDERIKYMLDDSGAKIWLVQEELLDRIKKTGFSGHILSLSDKSLYNTEKFQAEKKVKPENLAYVIYTSGSTGKPKGVMIEHRNVGNLAAWYSREYGILAGTRSIQLYDYSFDGSVEDIFGSLLYGATLHLADRSLIFDRVKFQEYIEHHEIHIINFIPGMIKELLAGSKKRLSSIKAIISGAERLDEELKNELLGMGYMVYNNYGPTETTVDTLSSKCTSEKVSIGRPVQNSCAYILDEDMNLMPVGIAGELYISGKGVARGYINDSITTEEKFKSSIFDKYERMYKTGDIAKWRENGEIDFIGRIDHQVKIMGFRIELEEIESALMKMPEIKKAVVMVKENPTSLMGFIETKQVISPEEKPNTVATFKERLKKNLPTYMVPAELFIIEKMPLTVNGKIDRQKLMKMDFTEQLPLKKCLPPESEIEKTILDTWKKVLAINDIGITDDFFEIGGNSLSLIRVYSLLNEKLPKRLSVQNLFDYRTIKDLAVLLNGKSQSAIERSSGLSPIQEIEF